MELKGQSTDERIWKQADVEENKKQKRNEERQKVIVAKFCCFRISSKNLQGLFF